MKKISILPILALAIGVLVSCSNGANVEELKVKQQALTDSLVTAGLTAKAEELTAKCTAEVQAAAKLRLDSLQANAAKSTGKKDVKPSKKPTTPQKPTPTPPKPTPTPTPTPKPQTQVEKQKDRAIDPGKNVEQQKDRGIDLNQRKDQVEQQKKRGGAVAVPPQN